MCMAMLAGLVTAPTVFAIGEQWTTAYLSGSVSGDEGTVVTTFPDYVGNGWTLDVGANGLVLNNPYVYSCVGIYSNDAVIPGCVYNDVTNHILMTTGSDDYYMKSISVKWTGSGSMSSGRISYSFYSTIDGTGSPIGTENGVVYNTNIDATIRIYVLYHALAFQATGGKNKF